MKGNRVNKGGNGEREIMMAGDKRCEEALSNVGGGRFNKLFM